MLTLMIDTDSKQSYYEQLYCRLRDLIRNGELISGTKLPSGRNMAEKLQISRNTVSLAYDQLVSEGYIEARPKSGYYVCKLSGQLRMSHSEERKETTEKSETVYKYNFTPFSIDIHSFPYSTWRKLYSRALNDLDEKILLRGDNQGDYELRAAVASYLNTSRAVKCSAEQILIGAGNDYLLQLLCQIFSKDTVVAMENPTYPKAYKIIKKFGFSISPIPVNKNGIDIDELKKTDAKLVYVTPSHQYPLGVIMPIVKRSELLSWAEENKDRYIIEDDHDSEFRYKGKPIPSLQGFDNSDSVIYMGTFSRAISPGIRVGYLVLPQRLLNSCGEQLLFYSSTVSRTEQTVLTYFIKEGYFERHLNKMRKQYKARHDRMLTELKIFGDRIKISGEYAGLYLVVTFQDHMINEAVLLKAAVTLNMCIRTLKPHYIIDTEQYSSILLGFACIEEENIAEGIKALYHFLYQ